MYSFGAVIICADDHATVSTGSFFLPRNRSSAAGRRRRSSREIQQLFRRGQRHLIIDMRGYRPSTAPASARWSGGTRPSQRLGGSLRLAAVQAAVVKVLEDSRLSAILGIYESVKAAGGGWPWRTVRSCGAASLSAARSCGSASKWPMQLTGIDPGTEALIESGKKAVIPFHRVQPFIELAKLVAAALIGALVTAMHRAGRRAIGRDRSNRRRRCCACPAR